MWSSLGSVQGSVSGWTSSITSVVTPAPIKPAGDVGAPDDTRANEDPWKTTMTDNHNGVAADLHRLRAEVMTMIEAAKQQTEERLRNLERLCDVQGRALRSLLASNSQTGASVALVKQPSIAGDRMPLSSTPYDPVPDMMSGETGQMGALCAEVAQLRAELAGYTGSAMTEKTKDEWLTSLPYVGLERYERDLQTIAVDRDMAMVKAGFLAVALAESTNAETQATFSNLKKKEQSLLDARPSSRQPLPDFQSATGTNANAPVGAPRTSGDLQHDSTFTIELDARSGEKIGATVNCRDGETLVVEKIGDGLIRSWNKSYFQHAVKVGDHIVAVNGESSGIDSIQSELEKRKQLRITFKRTLSSGSATTVRV